MLYALHVYSGASMVFPAIAPPPDLYHLGPRLTLKSFPLISQMSPVVLPPEEPRFLGVCQSIHHDLCLGGHLSFFRHEPQMVPLLLPTLLDSHGIDDHGIIRGDPGDQRNNMKVFTCMLLSLSILWSTCIPHCCEWYRHKTILKDTRDPIDMSPFQLQQRDKLNEMSILEKKIS